MKKILYIVQLPPPIYGVTVINSFIVNSELINANLEKDIIELSYSKSLSELKKLRIKKFILLYKIWIKLFIKLFAKKPDLVYYTIPPAGFGFYKEIPNILLLKLFRKKVIYHFHGKGISEKVNTPLKKKIHQFCLSNSNIIHLSQGLVVSEFKNLHLRNTKFFIAQNGVGKVVIENQSGQRTNRIDLLFLSNIQKSKGIFLLLSVFSKLLPKYPNIYLNIIGDFRDTETETEFLNFVSQNGLKKNILLWGAKYDADKHIIINKCDILIHPSFNDAFPLVILEAMQHGLAIIGSDQGAIPEIIEKEFGFIFPTGSETELSEVLEFLITDNEKRELMKASAKKKFNETYTSHHFEERINKIFKQI